MAPQLTLMARRRRVRDYPFKNLPLRLRDYSFAITVALYNLSLQQKRKKIQKSINERDNLLSSPFPFLYNPTLVSPLIRIKNVIESYHPKASTGYITLYLRPSWVKETCPLNQSLHPLPIRPKSVLPEGRQ